MKLTEDQILALIRDETYTRPGNGTLTICVLTLHTGATVTGDSNVIDPANFDAAIGQQMAKKDAVSKLWALEGYAVKRDATHRIVQAAKAAHNAVRVLQAALGQSVAPEWSAVTPEDKRSTVQYASAILSGQEIPVPDDQSQIEDLKRTMFEEVVASYAA